MRKEIPIETLKIGMIFSKPIYFDDSNNIFLPENTALTEKDMDVLKKWNFKQLFTDGIDISYSNENNYTQVVNTSTLYSNKLNQINKQSPLNILLSLHDNDTYQTYTEVIYNLEKIFEKLKQRQRLKDKPVSQIVQTIKQLVQNNSDICVGYIINSEIQENEIAKSAVNSAILGCIISQNLQLSSDEIDEIVTASILHDVGMLRVNQDIIQKSEKLSELEMQTIKAHTSYGFKCVVSELMYTENIGKIIMQHHEHWDGTGYPRRLADTHIDIGARILAVADAFIAMTSPKSYRPAMLAYDAIKSILEDNGRKFDPNVIKAIIQSIGIYPIGSVVLLNNASVCVVIKNNIKTPLRPDLKVIIDKDGLQINQKSNEILNLEVHKNLFIIKAIDPKEYQ